MIYSCWPLFLGPRDVQSLGYRLQIPRISANLNVLRCGTPRDSMHVGTHLAVKIAWHLYEVPTSASHFCSLLVTQHECPCSSTVYWFKKRRTVGQQSNLMHPSYLHQPAQAVPRRRISVRSGARTDGDHGTPTQPGFTMLLVVRGMKYRGHDPGIAVPFRCLEPFDFQH